MSRYLLLPAPGLPDVGGEHWYSGYYDTGWSQWQQGNGNFTFTIDGHEIPEPTTLLPLGLGVVMLRRNCMFLSSGSPSSKIDLACVAGDNSL